MVQAKTILKQKFISLPVQFVLAPTFRGPVFTTYLNRILRYVTDKGLSSINTCALRINLGFSNLLKIESFRLLFLVYWLQLIGQLITYLKMPVWIQLTDSSL